MVSITYEHNRGNIFATVIATKTGYIEIDEIYTDFSKSKLKETVILIPRRNFIVKRYWA